MAEDSIFGGFDAFAGHLTKSDQGEDYNVIDPEELKQKLESLDNYKAEDKDSDDNKKNEEEKKDVDNSKDKGKKTPDTKEEEADEDSKDGDSDNKKDGESSGDDDEENGEDIEIEEEQLVDTFADVFANELGWEFDEEDKPKNVKDLVKYMQDVIESNSEPKYPNDEVKALSEFVQNGGSIREFANKVYSPEVDLDNIDLTKESNQKAVIKENLRSRGYSEARIDKLIDRYQETSSLEEEANDSLEEVKAIKEEQKQALLENRKIQRQEQEKQQLAFVHNVEKIITDTTEVLGVSISSKDKKDLTEYIFKPEADGMTRYQKEYNNNLSNLVESAYLTMKGSKLTQQLKQKATTDATKTLKLKLKSKGKSTKNTMSDNDTSGSKVTNLWDIASRELRNFNN